MNEFLDVLNYLKAEGFIVFFRDKHGCERIRLKTDEEIRREVEEIAR